LGRYAEPLSCRRMTGSPRADQAKAQRELIMVCDRAERRGAKGMTYARHSARMAGPPPLRSKFSTTSASTSTFRGRRANSASFANAENSSDSHLDLVLLVVPARPPRARRTHSALLARTPTTTPTRRLLSTSYPGRYRRRVSRAGSLHA
jgi:hypothetical protein